MNLLIDALPSAVLIGGAETPINTDFRDCLRVILAYEDPHLTAFEKQVILLGNLFPTPPANPLAACEVAVKFLNGGKIEGGEGEDGPRVFSWEKDAQLIYAAFRQTHNIDLSTASLHWWQFLALFMDLGADTAFCQLTALRKRVKLGRASKEERQAAREMGDAFIVEEIDNKTLEEREQEADFLRLVREGEARRRNG